MYNCSCHLGSYWTTY